MTKNKLRAVALDLGASGGKMFAGTFDGRRIRVTELHRFPNHPVERDGSLFWDIDAIYTHLLSGLRKAASEGFSSFGTDAFCNDFGLLNAAGGLFSPIYMYRDRRTEGIPEWMDGIIPPDVLYRSTGCQRARFNTLVQLAAQRRGPEAWMLEKASALLFVPDLLNYFLSGEKGAEFTIATVSQVFNRLNGGWDREILQAFDIPDHIFPGIISTGEVYGSARREVLESTGADTFSICTVGHHDTASAVAAVPAMEKNFAFISSGTWSLMGVETDHMITTPESLKENFANEGGVGGRNRFLKNIMGLWILQECQRQFDSQGRPFTFDELDRLAEHEKAFRSLIHPDDPVFFDPGDMIGRIRTQCRQTGQPEPETPGQFNRCIKESLALAYRRTLETIESLAGITITSVHIVGGGSNSNLLNRFAASSMNRPVLVGPVEAAALGNLCVQMIAAGELENLHHARAVIRDSIELLEYLPEDPAAWDEAYGRYMRLFSQ